MRCPEDPKGPSAEVVLSVPDMRCRHCARAVSARIGDVACVVAVEADVTTGTIRVRGTADADALLAAVADAGHEATQVSRRAVPDTGRSHR